MIHTIENERLTVSVKEFGSELTSVKSKTDGYEYLWQGDPSVWSGQSPILFPIVGRLLDDEYRLNGAVYSMPKHGFARKSAWALLEKDESHISMILSESEETLKTYPYAFDLIVTFQLEENALHVTHTVVNKNESVMYFSLGAHPGFRCRIGDKLEFEEPESLSAEKIDLERSLLLPQEFPLLRNERDLIITEDIFRADALILHGMRSRRLKLYADGGAHIVAFDTGGSPYLGIWAKPGAPYVCIEPWWGVNDGFDRKNDLSEKNAIQALSKEDIFQAGWTAIFA